MRAPSFAQLDLYCERVAVAIGRISVQIFGETSPAGQRVAAELGRALQLTYILRDLADDARLHRLYLPRELLHAHGIFATMPSWVLGQPALPNVCRDLALTAERHYAAAATAIAACSRWTMRTATVLLGMNPPFSTSFSRAAGVGLTSQYGSPLCVRWLSRSVTPSREVKHHCPNGDCIGAREITDHHLDFPAHWKRRCQ